MINFDQLQVETAGYQRTSAMQSRRRRLQGPSGNLMVGRAGAGGMLITREAAQHDVVKIWCAKGAQEDYLRRGISSTMLYACREKMWRVQRVVVVRASLRSFGLQFSE